MKIGVMGGTFDPIHNGHLMLGEAAYEKFGLDEVWFMPNGNPPHKKKSSIRSDIRDRAAMTALAIEGRPGFKLESYEAGRKEVSYTYETLNHFHELRKEDRFYFILGADSLFSIEGWVHPEEIFSACVILAAFRDEIDTPQEMQVQIDYLKRKYQADIRILNAPMIPVSSRELRKAVEQNQPISGYVPEKVEQYILEEGLYGTKDR